MCLKQKKRGGGRGITFVCYFNPFWDSKPELFSDIACLRIPYQPSCGTVALNGPFFFFFWSDHRATDFTLSKICGTAPKICRTFQQ